MSKSWLIHIDNLFAPFYWLVKTISNAVSRQPRNIPKKVLIIKFFGMGSIVRIADVVDHIYPQPNITFLTLKKNQPLLTILGHPGIYIGSNPIFLVFEVIVLLFKVWSNSYLLIDCERKSNLAGILREILAFGKPKVYFDFGRSTNLKHRRIIDLNEHSSIKSLELALAPLGAPVRKSPPKATEVKNVVVNINAGDYLPERKYPSAHFKTLVSTLATTCPDWNFVFTGLKNEHAVVTSLVDDLELSEERLQNVAGSQSLEQFIDCINRADLVITNDSSPLHWANYLGVRCVAIWGPTSAEKVGYPDSSLMKNIGLKMDCSPCFAHPKSDVARYCDGKISCLNDLNPKVVAREILEWTSVKDTQIISA